MTNSFPLPTILPFERFRPSDGLLINSERWRKAHDYHRQRQNFHYQSLHQPGIVCGLGVTLISSDSDEPELYRDGRGVKLQPGIAIDLKGNPIIVPSAENVQIAVEPPREEALTVYIVVSYRDPDELMIREGVENAREQFRIDVKTQSPNEDEIEVCRVVLPPNKPIKLEPTKDVFLPTYCQLDFRYRNWATLRHQGTVRIAQIEHDDPQHNLNFLNLDYLISSTEVIYPKLQGIEPVGLIRWKGEEQQTQESGGKIRWRASDLEAYDLIYLTGSQFTLSPQQSTALKTYLDNGGVLFVDSLGEDSPIYNYIRVFAQKELSTPLKPIGKRHPLRRMPFLFAGFGNGGSGQPINLLCGGGIILATGNVAGVWGLDPEMQLSREILRSGQELGVNILHYAWQRRLMSKLQQHP